MNYLDRIKYALFHGGLKESLKSRGLLNTVQFTLANLYYDLRQGTQTSGIVTAQDLDTTHPNKRHTIGYSASHYLLVRRIFKALDIDLREAVLVDMGCGKGRVLLVAMTFGFKKIIGVEFSEELSRICVHNVANVRRRDIVSNSDIEIVTGDAADYTIPTDANVFYFFNPFGPEVLNRVLLNIEDSLKIRDRTLYVIYVNPVHKEQFLRKGYQAVKTFDAAALVMVKHPPAK